MRVGISVATALRAPDARTGGRWLVERAAAAREAGLDSLFVGDHHSTAPMTYYQNVPVLARMLAEWGDRPAGALFLLPLWHPVLLAEQIGTLAALHEGPFVMQCAIGPDDNQFPAFGVNVKHRPSMLRGVARHHAAAVGGRGGQLGGALAASRTRASRPSLRTGWRCGSGRWRVRPWTAPPGSETAGWRRPGLTRERAARHSAEYLERRQIHGHEDPGSRRHPAGHLRRGERRGGGGDGKADRGGRATAASTPRRWRSAARRRWRRSSAQLEEAGYTDVIVRNLMPTQEHALASIGRLAEVRASLA